MTERSSHLPQHVHNAAARYWSRQQAGDQSVERELKSWLDADQRHRVAYEGLLQDWHESERLIEARIGQSRKLPRAPVYMRQSVQVAFGAIATVLLLGATTLWLVRPGSPLSPVAVAQAASFSSELGQIRHLTLADGTQLILDTDTQVAVSTGPHHLQFNVKKGRVRVLSGVRTHITLKTAQATYGISADGKFDIAVEPDVTVTAITGPVRLSGERAEVEIAPGERLAMDGSNQAKHRATALDTQWTSGMVVLQATPLSEAIAAINRYNRLQIRLDAVELSKRRVTGAFDARDPLSFARSVAKLFGARAKPAVNNQIHISM